MTSATNGTVTISLPKDWVEDILEEYIVLRLDRTALPTISALIAAMDLKLDESPMRGHGHG